MRKKKTLKGLERRDWELWVLAIGMLLVFTFFLVIIYFYWEPSEINLSEYTIDILLLGFIALSLLFCAYVIFTRRTLKKLQKSFIAEQLAAAKSIEETVESMIDCVILIDLKGRITQVNKVVETTYGYKKDEIIGKTPWEFLIKEDISRFREKLKETIEKGSIREFECTVATKDDREILTSFSSTMLKDVEGKPKSIVTVLRDITERKQAEEALQESEHRYRLLFERNLAAIFRNTLDGKILDCNESFVRLMGYDSREEILKHSTLDFYFSPHDREKFIAQLQEKGVLTNFEICLRRKDGSPVWTLANVVLIKGEKDTPAIIQGTSVDITEQKKVDEELKSSRDELRSLYAHLQSVREEERTHIAREIHDELGQTLTALKMDLSWLRHKLPQNQKSLLEKIKASLKLIDDTIRMVQRISTELRPGILDDLGLMAAIEWQTEGFQKRTGIKCEVTLYPDDIVVAPNLSVTIFRVLQETLTNVARHANATGVKVSLKKKASKLELKVKDNGKGITEKQISNPKSFGLIGIRERIRFWKGEAKIKGVRGKGTTVTVNMPLKDSAK